jgi:hypothetical protein
MIGLITVAKHLSSCGLKLLTLREKQILHFVQDDNSQENAGEVLGSGKGVDVGSRED